ncbi:MAG: Minf_1886 family protein [Terrimicrobiaceae bacterium]
MQQTGFQEAVEKISRKDDRYHAEAYAFLRDSLEATMKRRKKTKKESGSHVGAEELLDGFRLHALDEFGPMSLMVLDYWGVRASEDVGNMVFNLVDAQVFGKTDEDTIESFRDVFDFNDVFVLPFQPAGEPLNAGPAPAVFTGL